MAYILHDKTKVEGSRLYVFITGWLSTVLLSEPVEHWSMVLFSTEDDLRIGAWPVDDWRSANNTHEGAFTDSDFKSVDQWLDHHNASEELKGEVKAIVSKIGTGLSTMLAHDRR